MAFEDIFSRDGKYNDSDKDNKPIIIIDIHEKNSEAYYEIIMKDNLKTEIKPLKIGDYVIYDCVVERKTTTDLWNSIISKRIFNQINKMNLYPERILLIEGKINESWNNQIRGFIMSAIINHKINIIFTKDGKESADYLYSLAKIKYNEKKDILLIKSNNLSIEDERLRVLQSFTGIGEINSKKLLNKYKTLKDIFASDLEELKKIIGKRAENISRILSGMENKDGA